MEKAPYGNTDCTNVQSFWIFDDGHSTVYNGVRYFLMILVREIRLPVVRSPAVMVEIDPKGSAFQLRDRVGLSAPARSSYVKPDCA
jgi:hypothetical protein